MVGVTIATTGLLLPLVLSAATSSTSILDTFFPRMALIEPVVILSVASPANLASSPLGDMEDWSRGQDCRQLSEERYNSVLSRKARTEYVAPRQETLKTEV